jgi:hypothetical protein
MRWTGLRLIVLAVSFVGCARGDWTTETLTLVDVTGTWEGVFRAANVERTTRWALQQKGGKVKGEVRATDGEPLGSIEGLINGELFSWQLTGQFIRFPVGNPPSRSYRGQATITIDEMTGRADGFGCPCIIRLRRAESDARGKDPQPSR